MKRIFSNTVMLAASVAMSFCLTSSSALAQPSVRYEIIELGTLGGTQSFARDINNQGQITGNARTSDNQLHAYIWENGVMTSLGTLPGHSFSRGYSINETGQIVGESDNNQSQAFLWSEGTMTNIGNLGLGTAVAHGNNARGQIVGASSTVNGLRAFLFDRGRMTGLGTLGGNSSRAWSINNAGAIVGLARNSSGVSHAFLWERGTMKDLGSLAGDAGFSEAYSLNAAGAVVGRSAVPEGSQRAFLWSRGTMTNLGTVDDLRFSRANEINNRGTIVGTASRFEGFSGTAVVWLDGVIHDLNTLVEPTGFVLTSAEGINDAGEIVGFGTLNGQTRAFLAIPARQ